jgi:hypothetical protein
LQYWHLKSLEAEEVENPHGPHLAPQKMYSVWDVAEKAIAVNGPTGENKQLRKQRADEAKDHADKAARVAEDQAQKAKALAPNTPVEMLCKRKGVTPSCTLTKERALKAFNLDWRELQDMALPVEMKTNPRNLKWAPMKLYKAGDVAKAVIKKRRLA